MSNSKRVWAGALALFAAALVWSGWAGETRNRISAELGAAASQADPGGAKRKADNQEAREVLKKALAEKPDNAVLWMQLGFVEQRLGDADGSEEAFSKAIAIDPRLASAHFMLGLIYEKRGDKARAVSAWETCLRLAGGPGDQADPHLKELASKHLEHLKAKP